jgi:hypothetical protein
MSKPMFLGLRQEKPLLNYLLQYLSHLSIAVQHPTDREDLARLWTERERVREEIDRVTRPRW